MTASPSSLPLSPSRLGALLMLGSLAVHELAYRLGHGEGAEEALRAHGHAYLTVVGPLAVVLAGLVLGGGIARWASGRSTTVEGRWRLTSLWPVLALALGAIFSVQELLEGMLAGGHPSGVGALTAGGGGIAFAAAAGIGHVLALVVELAGRVTSDAPRAPDPVLMPTGEWLLWLLPASPLPAAVRSRASARGPPLPA
ncbi:MAG TPA: hypothetical protein VGV36_02915 [Solirubrobacteraceae bacterium]|nr:hypothetical protein [Solirubrobacteraceae bacterium]